MKNILPNKTLYLILGLLVILVLIIYFLIQKKPTRAWTYIWYFDGQYSTQQKQFQDELIQKLKTGSIKLPVNLSLIYNVAHNENGDITAKHLTMNASDDVYTEKDLQLPSNSSQNLLQKHIQQSQQTLPADYYLLLTYDNGLNTDSFSELDQTLSSAQEKINIVMFEADYQASLETTYLIKDGADLLVANQGVGQDVNGYQDYLSSARQNNNPESLAKSLADIYFAEAKKTGQSVSVSVIQLSLIEQLATLFDDLLLEINLKRVYPDSAEIWQLFEFSRNRTQSLENSFFDFFDFIRVYNFNATSANIKETAQDILNLQEEIVLHSLTYSGGNNCVSYCLDLDSAFGLSFFFPENFEDPKLDDYLEYESSLFLDNTYWDEMLADYFYSQDRELVETPGFDEPLFIDCQPEDCNCDGVIDWKDWLCRVRLKLKK